MKSTESSISGFTVRGSWREIVEHGERITQALNAAGVSGEAFEEWEEWRPIPSEQFNEEMKRKTASQATIDEGPGEQADIPASQDLRHAVETLHAALDEIRNTNSKNAIDEIQKLLRHMKRAADTTGRQAFRVIQDVVFRNVMMLVGGQYFSNHIITASLRQTSLFWIGDEDTFLFKININDDDLKEEVSNHLDTSNEEAGRQQRDARTETSNINDSG